MLRNVSHCTENFFSKINVFMFSFLCDMFNYFKFKEASNISRFYRFHFRIRMLYELYYNMT